LSNELIIKKSSSGIEIALLSDKKLSEFHKEAVDSPFQVGDFYLGKVRKISPSLNAAFVNVGGEKDGFLTYFDLGPNVRSLQKFVRMTLDGNPNSGDLDSFELEEQTVKTGKIGNVLRSGELALVQVIKEPIANKGPKITCDISLPGRYFILVPFSRQVSISKKIGNVKEKTRLKDLAHSIKPKNFGVIVRTVSEGVAIEELDKDLRDLLKKWDELVIGLRKAKVGEKVIGNANRVDSLLRDILNDSFTQISVDDAEIHASLKKTLEKYNMDAAKILRHYQGKLPIFDQFGVNKQIKSSFGKNIPFSGGAYLIIEHTEALHVVDVNSGNTSFDPQNREENVFKVNTEAVDEIARQIRLRDMGGIIVIDFIDMKDPKKKAALHTALRDAMAKDRARHNILPMSKFGLVQLTRERVRPAIEIATSEICSTCLGSGRVDSSVQLLGKIENEVTYLWDNMNQKGITLRANALITHYFKAGMPSIRMKWWLRTKRWLKLETDPNLPLTGYVLINSDKQIINNSL
jgi:ribonuclease G